MMKKLLVVIDAQNDFIDGALRNEDAIKALPTVKELAQFAQDNFESHTIFTRDTHHSNYLDTFEGKNLPIPHCIVDTAGWQVHDSLRPYMDPRFTLNKKTFGSNAWDLFYMDNFDVDEIVLCGFDTDICVLANYFCIKAVFPDVKITVISDACAGSSPENHNSALKLMKVCHANLMTWKEFKDEVAANH